jgi:cytochrome c-type biogenesis protein CcmF
MVTEKRGSFKAWTRAVGDCGVSRSSLLGTFLVRSGVLTSVHAFASDPAARCFHAGFFGGGGGCVAQPCLPGVHPR